MRSLSELLPPGFRPNAPFVVSAVCVGAIAVTALVALVDVTPAVIATSADAKDVRAFESQLARHESAAELASARFAGRSLFVMPPPPYRPPPPPPPLPPEPKPEPKPVVPTAPAEYSGPKPMGMIGGLVYFDGIPPLRMGEDRDGLKVIGVEMPSHVRVSHRGGTYLVPVWDRSDLTALSRRGGGADSPIRSVRPVPDGPPPDAAAEGSPDADGGTPGAAAPSEPAPSGASPAPVPPPAETPAPSPEAAPAPAPASTPRSPRPASPPPSEAPGSDIGVPSNQVPAPLSQADIDAMSRREAQAALAAVSRARNIRDLDEATKARLRQEFDMLITRVRTAPAEETR
jgi:hypothetical protein